MNRPILLTKYELTDRIDLALKKIGDIHQTKDYWSNQIIIESMFISLFSCFEICINDLIAILFEEIPGKIPKSNVVLTKDDLMHGDTVKKLIEKCLLSAAYKALPEYFKEFEEFFGISTSSWHKNKNAIIEYKATRNILIHNDLFINTEYTNKAGPESRKKDWNGKNKERLSIDPDYFEKCILLFNELFSEIKSVLAEKYSKQTRINVFKSIWEHLFKSTIMKFNDWIEIDLENDKIIGWQKDNGWYVNLSHSEKIFIDFIGENFMQSHPPKHLENWELSYPLLRCLGSNNLTNLQFLIANEHKIFKLLHS